MSSPTFLWMQTGLLLIIRNAESSSLSAHPVSGRYKRARNLSAPHQYVTFLPPIGRRGRRGKCHIYSQSSMAGVRCNGRNPAACCSGVGNADSAGLSDAARINALCACNRRPNVKSSLLRVSRPSAIRAAVVSSSARRNWVNGVGSPASIRSINCCTAGSGRIAGIAPATNRTD